MGCFTDPSVEIATLVRPFPADEPYIRLADPNLVKAVRADDGRALYFSRSVIPYMRGVEPEQWPSRHQYFTHVGMYAYRADALAKVVKLPQSTLEQTESLEQLRWLQAGMTIATAITECPTIGIDTPDDLQQAIEYLKSLHR